MTVQHAVLKLAYAAQSGKGSSYNVFLVCKMFWGHSCRQTSLVPAAQILAVLMSHKLCDTDPLVYWLRPKGSSG